MRYCAFYMLDLLATNYSGALLLNLGSLESSYAFLNRITFLMEASKASYKKASDDSHAKASRSASCQDRGHNRHNLVGLVLAAFTVGEGN